MTLQNKNMEELFQEGYCLPDFLPYLEFFEGDFVLCDGSLGKVWKLRPIEIEGKTPEDLTVLAAQWESLFTRLPHEHLACQFIVSSDQRLKDRIGSYSSYKEQSQETGKFSYDKESHINASLNSLFIHKNECFVPKQICIYLTLRYFPQWAEKPFWSNVASFSIISQSVSSSIEGQLRRHRLEFGQHVQLVEGALQGAGIGYEALDGADLVQFLYCLLNPKRSLSIPKVNFNDEVPIRDQLLYHVPKASGDGFNLENRHIGVVTLKELPSSTIVGMFTREFYEGSKFCLLDLPQDFLFVINFTVVGLARALETLNMQKSFAFMHKENWLGDQSVEAVEKKKELDETIANMFKGGGAMVHARMHWIFYDETPEKVDSICNDFVNSLSRLNCGGIKESIIGASLFLTCLPLNFDPYYEKFIRRSRRLISANAADMLPIAGSFAGTRTPAQMYFNRRGEVIFLDFFDSNINPHGVIVGASGAGKSFFVNDFVLQNERLGAHFFVLDKGDSYKKLCRVLNGQYFSFDLNTPVCINPFANEPTPENLSFLLSLLSQMACGGDERDRLNREEEGLLYKAVLKAYEKKKMREAEVTLSDVVSLLIDNGFNEQYGINSLMGPTLALRLTPFTIKGPYGGFFDGVNRLRIDNCFTVFELANLGSYPDLQITVLLNLMFFMTNFVAAPHMKPKRKYLLIDEAWSLLKVKNTADFITNAFKTFRKYRASVVAITQEMADLTRQESGIAIVANASNKVFLKQEAAVIDLLKEKLSLGDEIVKALKTVETVKGKFSEAFVITDSCKGVLRLVPDPFLYWVANSEPRNNEYLYAKALLHSGNLIAAVKECAKEYPYGL